MKSSTRISSTLSRSAQTSPGATPVSSVSASSLGLSEVAYTRVTYDIAMAAAREMVAANPRMTFCFVSGVGTDSTGKGRTMWARVKGKTENALLALGFKAAHMFRPDTFSRSAMCNRKQDGCRRRTTSPGHLPADSSPAAEQLDDDLEPWPRHDSGRRNGYSKHVLLSRLQHPGGKTMTVIRQSVFVLVALLSACGGGSDCSSPTAPSPAPASSAFALQGDPESAQGATWTYRGSLDGVTFDLQGILLKLAVPAHLARS